MNYSDHSNVSEKGMMSNNQQILKNLKLNSMLKFCFKISYKETPVVSSEMLESLQCTATKPLRKPEPYNSNGPLTTSIIVAVKQNLFDLNDYRIQHKWVLSSPISYKSQPFHGTLEHMKKVCYILLDHMKSQSSRHSGQKPY